MNGGTDAPATPTRVSGSDDPWPTPGERAHATETDLEARLVREMARSRLFDEALASVRVGHFTLLQRLGAGGMGTVYTAYDNHLERKVAIKFLAPELDDRELLLREARAMARLNHPNVVAVHEVGEYQGRIFVAMEFIVGRTLREVLRDRGRGEADTPGIPHVLDLFLQAGRGVAAAHQAGLVHADFKPENVLVGADGRVRVLDFGLARAVDVGALAPSERPAAAGGATSTGKLVGTPAYMAPEQFMGGRAGTSTDQYSFCVALYEGLHGERPFRGDDLAALIDEVVAGVLPNPPRRIPGWLRAAVERGLAREPSRRWPSMHALLAELSRGRTRARFRVAAAAVAAVTGVVGAAWAWHAVDEAQRTAVCAAEGASITADWNDEARGRVRDGLLATGVSYAAPVAEQTVAWLDRQVATWAQSRTEACLDAGVRAVWDAETLARSLWCHDERRAELAALIDELGHADADMARNAVQAAAGLPPLGPCRDVASLARLPAPPTDRREQVRAVRDAVARVHSLERAGRLVEGVTAASAVLADATALGWPPLVALAGLRYGSVLDDSGRYAEAEAVLEEAYFTAMAAGVPTVAVDSGRYLAFTVGEELGRHQDGMRWSRHEAVALAALEGRDVLRTAGYLNNRGIIHYRRSQFAEARPLFERALALQEQALGPEHPEVASRLNNLGNLESSLGKYEESKAYHRQALAIRERTLGPGHPEVGASLANLANSLQMCGEDLEAKPLYARAITIFEAALGPEHPLVADTMQNLAAAHRSLGERDDAIRLHERAQALLARSVGTDHPDFARSLYNLSVVLEAAGDLERARSLGERALAIRERAFGPDHPEVASALQGLANTALGMGELDRARELYARSLAVDEKTLGRRHVNLGYPLWGLASVALAQHRPADAIAFAERALDVREHGEAPDHEVAEARFVLAQALWDADRGRERAVALADQAAAGFRRAGSGSVEHSAEVDTWLAARRESSRGETPVGRRPE